MSLLQTVRKKYGAHRVLTDRTDRSPSVSFVSESPAAIQGKNDPSVSFVSESPKGFLDICDPDGESQKRPGYPLTELTKGFEERRRELLKDATKGKWAKKYYWRSYVDVDPVYAIVALAIRDVGTCELRIKHERYDGILLAQALGEDTQEH